jgi:hypothetical protein
VTIVNAWGAIICTSISHRACRTVLLLPIDLLAAPTCARPTKAFASFICFAARIRLAGRS